MKDDIAAITGGNGMDASEAGLFGAPTVQGENERTISGEVLQPFAFYLLTVESATEGYAFKDMSKPEIRLRVKVEEGPEGSEGKGAFLALGLYVGKNESTGEKDADGKFVFVPKSAEKYAEHLGLAEKRLNRIGRIGGFAKLRPAGADGDSLKEYAAQFVGMKFIGDVRVDRSGEKKGYNAVNTIWWDSIAAVDDPAHDKKLKAAGISAYEEAQEAIAKVNKRSAAPKR